jgi:hypothetical protein
MENKVQEKEVKRREIKLIHLRRRITVQSQPGQIVLETLCGNNPSQKSSGGVAQGVGPEFKSQYHKKKK